MQTYLKLLCIITSQKTGDCEGEGYGYLQQDLAAEVDSVGLYLPSSRRWCCSAG